MTYLVANWKSHHTITQSLAWLNKLIKLKPRFSSQTKTIVCLPFTDIPEFNRQLSVNKLPFSIAAQNVSPFSAGQHTGEVTAQMLSELVTHCLVGHSERRRQFQETNQEIAQKCQQLLSYSITPIICLDVPYLEDQIKTLFNQNINLSQCIFAYEPLTAIGTDKPENPQTANQIISKIALLTQTETPIIYGGSINANNILNYLSQPQISGVLVGTDSLKPQDFANIINVTTKQYEA